MARLKLEFLEASADRIREVKNFCRGKGESLQVMYSRLRTLVKETKTPDREGGKLFMKNLPPKLREASLPLLYQKHGGDYFSVDEAWAVVKPMDIGMANYEEVTSMLQLKGKEEVAPRGPKGGATSIPSSSTRRGCYECGEFGHRRNNCPKLATPGASGAPVSPPPNTSYAGQACNHCGKRNHTSDTCFQKFPHLRQQFKEQRAARAQAATERGKTGTTKPGAAIQQTASSTVEELRKELAALRAERDGFKAELHKRDHDDGFDAFAARIEHTLPPEAAMITYTRRGTRGNSQPRILQTSLQDIDHGRGPAVDSRRLPPSFRMMGELPARTKPAALKGRATKIS